MTFDICKHFHDFSWPGNQSFKFHDFSRFPWPHKPWNPENSQIFMRMVWFSEPTSTISPQKHAFPETIFHFLISRHFLKSYIVWKIEAVGATLEHPQNGSCMCCCQHYSVEEWLWNCAMRCNLHVIGCMSDACTRRTIVPTTRWRLQTKSLQPLLKEQSNWYIDRADRSAGSSRAKNYAGRFIGP